MTFDPSKHHRRSIRLKGYDYAQPGAYFVTLVTHNRVCLFGEIEAGEMRLNAEGDVVVGCWQAIPAHFARVTLDYFVVMPNHLHGIILITDEGVVRKGEASAGRGLDVPGRRAADASPLRLNGTQSGSLSAVIQNFKSVSTRRLNALRCVTPGAGVWQRNYYEHIVRDEADLARIRAYMQTNPARWVLDQLHPAMYP